MDLIKADLDVSGSHSGVDHSRFRVEMHPREALPRIHTYLMTTPIHYSTVVLSLFTQVSIANNDPRTFCGRSVSVTKFPILSFD